MITLTHLLNIISDTDLPVSEMVKPLRKYSASGEVNFKVEDKQGKMDLLEKQYGEGQIDHLDGVTVRFKDWWFNCRPSNTEPLLRLNIEAKNRDLLDEKFSLIKEQLGEPV